jgi:uncharacterized membrane protein YdjX (TVP38/TMEM64 family)
MYALVPLRTFQGDVVRTAQSQVEKMKRKWPLLSTLATLVVAAAWVAFTDEGRAAVLHAVAWLRAAGAAGVALFAALYLVSVLAFVPATWSAAFAGYIYGLSLGLAISLPATLAGAVLAFLFGRFIGRDLVDAWAARHPRLRAFDDALADGGYKLVVLLRLCLPHNLLNYGLAASRVRFGAYTAGTMIGGWPLTVLFCVGGSLAGNAAEVLRVEKKLGVWPIVLTVFGTLAAIAAFTWILKLARMELARQVPGAASPQPAPPPAQPPSAP